MAEKLGKMQCHDCERDLQRVGVSEFGRCSECERMMLFTEWSTIQESESL